MYLPIEIQEGDLDSGRFYIPCEFDGNHARFHLDTGSSYTSIEWNQLSAAYPAVGTKIRSSAAGKEKANDKVLIRVFHVGGLTRKNIELVRYDERSNQDNRLGMDVLSNSHLTFDFKRGRIGAEAKKSDRKLPISLQRNDYGLFQIEAALDGKSLRTLWDTGAELTVISPEIISERSSLFEHVMDIDQGTDATGAAVLFKLYRCSSLIVNGIYLDGHVLSMDFAPLNAKFGNVLHAILGFNSIRKLNWEFDLISNSWDATNPD